jgi:hypothetical protein
MGRPKIVEMNYHDFSRALQQAINAGTRLERSDGDQWTQYVAEHQINEVAMSSWGHYLHGPLGGLLRLLGGRGRLPEVDARR